MDKYGDGGIGMDLGQEAKVSGGVENVSLLCLHAQPRPAVSWKEGVSASTVSFLPDWLYGPLLSSRRLQSPPLFLAWGEGGR